MPQPLQSSLKLPSYFGEKLMIVSNSFFQKCLKNWNSCLRAPHVIGKLSEAAHMARSSRSGRGDAPSKQFRPPWWWRVKISPANLPDKEHEETLEVQISKCDFSSYVLVLHLLTPHVPFAIQAANFRPPEELPEPREIHPTYRSFAFEEQPSFAKMNEALPFSSPFSPL